MIAYQQWETPTPEDVWALTLYVDYLAGLMGLGEWAFTVKEADIKPNYAAEGMTPVGQVEVFPGAKHATITFAPVWQHWTPEFIRETAVHELCHLFFNPIQDLIALQEDSFGKLYLTPLRVSIEHVIEQEVDRMSRRWSESLPMPDLSAVGVGSPHDPATHWTYVKEPPHE